MKNMIKIFIKMEEGNDQITGWGDTSVKILEARPKCKHIKKLTQLILNDQCQPQRKIKPTRTLPLIKKNKTYDNPFLAPNLKNQPQRIDKLINIIEEHMKKAGRDLMLEQRLKNQSESNLPQKIQKIHPNLQQSVQQHTDDCSSSMLKKINRTLKFKKSQKISNLQKLKIQAVQYSSTSQHNSIAEKEKSLLLKKISKSALTNLNKKQKNHYFIVKKQRLSPQQASQETSKIAIQTKILANDELKIVNNDLQSYFGKEKYKEIIKTINKGSENPSIMIKSKSQQLRKSVHHRTKTNTIFQFSDLAQKNKTQIIATKQKSFNECVVVVQKDKSSEKMKKWNKLQNQVQNQQITFKKSIKQQKKNFYMEQQRYGNLVEVFQHNKAKKQTKLLEKRIKNDLSKKQQIVPKKVHRNMIEPINRVEEILSAKNRKAVTGTKSMNYNQFDDQHLSYQKIQS